MLDKKVGQGRTRGADGSSPSTLVEVARQNYIIGAWTVTRLEGWG